MTADKLFLPETTIHIPVTSIQVHYALTRWEKTHVESVAFQITFSNAVLIDPLLGARSERGKYEWERHMQSNT